MLVTGRQWPVAGSLVNKWGLHTPALRQKPK